MVPRVLRAPSHLAVGPGCLACRAAWRAGGRRPAHSVACSTAGIPGTDTPNCGAGLPGVSAGSGPPAVLLAAPLAFRAPSRLTVEPGCLACRWATARPRAVRAASFARRVVSKPGQALPPPTGTATRPRMISGIATLPHGHSRPLRHPHTSGARHADVRLAHRPEARVDTASTHRHGSRTPLPRCRLFLSGVTPFSWALHHFPGGVMLPNWCNAP